MSPAAPAGEEHERRPGILLLPGILLPPLVNALLARDLRRRGFQPVLNWGYSGLHPPPVAELARRLGLRLERRFPAGVPPLHAVGHSLGGLLLRRLWGDGALPEGGRFVFPTAGPATRPASAICAAYASFSAPPAPTSGRDAPSSRSFPCHPPAGS
ncbi:MAG: hypothetical protein ACE5H3_03765 [Planctomycetota bacterium]